MATLPNYYTQECNLRISEKSDNCNHRKYLRLLRCLHLPPVRIFHRTSSSEICSRTLRENSRFSDENPFLKPLSFIGIFIIWGLESKSGSKTVNYALIQQPQSLLNMVSQQLAMVKCVILMVHLRLITIQDRTDPIGSCQNF